MATATMCVLCHSIVGRGFFLSACLTFGYSTCDSFQASIRQQAVLEADSPLLTCTTALSASLASVKDGLTAVLQVSRGS